MDLLDRYVSAVKTYLPADQQDDIGKELSANIQSEMDDREAALGRPLSEAEQETILQQHGHPMVVAGRYRPNQGSLVFGRQWIGPTLFPFYLRTLQVVMGISFAIYLSVLVALIITGQQVTVGGVINTLLLQIFWQFAVVTLIFAAVDHYALPTMRWDARKPPALQSVTRSNEQQVPRLESVVQIVGITAFLTWAWFVLNNPTPVFGPVTGTYRLGPIWQQVALPVVLILLVSIAQAVVNLFRPDWTRLQLVVRLLTDLAVLGILAYLVRGDQWIVLARPNGDSGALNSFNQYMYYGLLIVLVGSVFVLLTDAWKLVRGERRRQPLRTAGAQGL